MVWGEVARGPKETIQQIIENEKKLQLPHIRLRTSKDHTSFLYAQSSGVVSLTPRSSTRAGVHFLLGVMVLTLLPSKLETGESMVTYSPKCILRQFGYDQGTFWMVEGNCVNVWEAESRYAGDGKDCWLGSLPSI